MIELELTMCIYCTFFLALHRHFQKLDYLHATKITVPRTLKHLEAVIKKRGKCSRPQIFDRLQGISRIDCFYRYFIYFLAHLAPVMLKKHGKMGLHSSTGH